MSHSPIPFCRPLTDDAEVQAAARVIRSGWLTQGPEVAAFEKEFAAFVQAPYACAVSNCSTALHMALRAAGVGPGDEVITVSHSFIATANAVRECGAVPVFVDIQLATFNLDPELISRAISPKTRAILCVHQLGLPCDLSSILEVATRRKLVVIEDAACAIGSEIRVKDRWERIGKPHGAIACFSFHPRKLLTTGDGGMITTSRADWDEKFRLWRQHGMNLPDIVRHSSPKVVFESYVERGYNYRMTDVQAAIGRAQLSRAGVILERRRRQAEYYLARLARHPELIVPAPPAWARSNWQSLCVRLPDGTDQREVMQELLDQGIPTRRGVMCAHREPAFRAGGWSCGAPSSVCDHERGCSRLARSEAAQDSGIQLPFFHELSEADQDRIVAALVRACRGSKQRKAA